MDVAFPLRFDRKMACVPAGGIAVHSTRQLVVVAGRHDVTLHCYSLISGEEVSVIGRGRGAGDMQFNWYYGGLCVTPGGTLLVADFFNNRVPEVDLDTHGRFVRVFGKGDGAPGIKRPQFVDCNGVHVAVSEEEDNRIGVLSYANGSLVGRLGGAIHNSSTLLVRGVTLLADGSGVAVADCNNHCVVLLSLVGNVRGVLRHDGLAHPVGVVQCAAADGDLAAVVTCLGAAGSRTRLMKIGLHSGVLESVDKAGGGDGQFSNALNIAALPGGGLVVLDYLPDASHLHLFTSMALRMRWVLLAVRWHSQQVRSPHVSPSHTNTSSCMPVRVPARARLRSCPSRSSADRVEHVKHLHSIGGTLLTPSLHTHVLYRLFFGPE